MCSYSQHIDMQVAISATEALADAQNTAPITLLISREQDCIQPDASDVIITGRLLVSPSMKLLKEIRPLFIDLVSHVTQDNHNYRYTGATTQVYTCGARSILALLLYSNLLDDECKKMQELFLSCKDKPCYNVLGLDGIYCFSGSCAMKLKTATIVVNILKRLRDVNLNKALIPAMEKCAPFIAQGMDYFTIYLFMKYDFVLHRFLISSDLGSDKYNVGAQCAMAFHTISRMFPSIYRINLSQFKIKVIYESYQYAFYKKTIIVPNPMSMEIEEYLRLAKIPKYVNSIMIAYNTAYRSHKGLISSFKINDTEYSIYWALGYLSSNPHTYAIQFKRTGCLILEGSQVIWISKSDYELRSVRTLFGGLNLVIYNKTGKLFQPRRL